jgi:hypothetical protein
MPIKKCTKKGKGGYKTGTSGKCYTGKGAKKKALKQQIAVKISQGKIKPKDGVKNNGR